MADPAHVAQKCQRFWDNDMHKQGFLPVGRNKTDINPTPQLHGAALAKVNGPSKPRRTGVLPCQHHRPRWKSAA
ncbi:MAG: hypothetical protein EOQ30_06215 [Mesorhizobium sp.]|nr:MAG: hypothetical protein EOQ29_22615 [Mesorhizobium sp.]RWA84978.1 MAG: hypothetical protein EOQ30_06215 [Mesorhizobium sp.]